MEIHDYSLLTGGLYVHWVDPEGHEEIRGTFPLETVAAVLAECGHTDGYTLFLGTITCIMDERPGYPDGIGSVEQVWETLTGDQKEEVAQKCIA
jgi:hypothetical protein